jgi:hypothetical protein
VPVRGELISGPGTFEIEVLDADPRRVKRVRIYPSRERRRVIERSPPRRADPRSPSTAAPTPDPGEPPSAAPSVVATDSGEPISPAATAAAETPAGSTAKP